MPARGTSCWLLACRRWRVGSACTVHKLTRRGSSEGDDPVDAEVVDVTGDELVSPLGIDQVQARPKADAAWLMTSGGANLSCGENW
jgi:hypothetical protein